MEKTLVAAMSDRAVNQLWWVNMTEATLALFFGVSAIFWPQLTLTTLVYLFSAFVLGLGIVQLFSSIMSIRARSTWWITMLLGVLSIGIGIYLVRHPGISFQAFVLLIGLLLLARGLLDIVRVFSESTSTRGNTSKILMAIFGISAVIAGIFIMVQPVAGGIAFVWILGVYAIIFGTLNMALGVELRSAFFDQGEVAATETATTDKEAPGRSNVPRTQRRTGAQPA